MNEIMLNSTTQYNYEVYGDPQLQALLIMPSWNLFNNNQWVMLIDYLKTHFYVITFSPSLNQSEIQVEDEAIFHAESIVEKAIHLLDSLKIQETSVLGFHTSCAYALLLANSNPDRVSKVALINNPYNLSKENSDPNYKITSQRYSRWKKWINKNSHEDKFLKGKYFYELVLNEFALTAVNNDIIGCSKITDIEFLKKTTLSPFVLPKINAFKLAENLDCPVCLIHGAFDDSAILENYKTICESKDKFEYTIIKNAAHMPHFFSPIETCSSLHNFLWDAPFTKKKQSKKYNNKKYKALYIPSPIGLGHVQRDLALVEELRKQEDISIEWLIPKGPARNVLEEAGEIINSYSDDLKSLLPKMIEASGNHKMNFFENWRQSEGLRIANFMTFLKAVKTTKYDLWIGDEAWDVDLYLHKNPQLKTAPYVFLTDFIGWIPIDKSPNSSEANLTKIYNFEMLKLVEENNKIRDKALYIGSYFDIIDESFGYNLPNISDWAKNNFEEIGYLYSFNSQEHDNDIMLYKELGLEPGQKFIIITVGGTIVGESLVNKAIKAWSHVYKKRPDLHCVVILGPSIKLDISTINTPNLIIKQYLKNLYKYFAITELAVVQGGLGTTMELAIRKRPFLYFPLKDHCEQTYHVKNRLEQYKSGKCLDWDTTDEFSLAGHILKNLKMDTSHYFDHDINNVKKAASLMLTVI